MANTVRIVVEADDKASGKLKGIQGALGDIGKIAGGVVVANGIMKLPGMFSSATDAAIDLGESTNAVDQIFGDSAGVIKDWGKENANSFGLTRASFQQMATPLGAMLKNAGMDMDEVTGSTLDLTARAADMASVFNTDVDDALAAISAGLRGEQDPLEKYGVSMNAAAVNAKAMAMSGKDSAAALTDQEKATARVALILEQTNDVAGDFNATSDQAANKARIQAAQQEELAAAIGQHLLPVQLKLTEAKLAFVKLLAEHLVPALAKTAEWIGEHVVPKLQEFGGFLRTEVGPVIKDVIIPALQEFATFAGEKFKEFAGYYESDIKPAVDNIAAAIEWVVEQIRTHWPEIEKIVKPVMDQVVNIVSTAVGLIKGALKIIIDLLGGDFRGAWETAKGMVKLVADSFVESIRNGASLIKGLVGLFKEAGIEIIQGLWDAAADKLRDHVIPWFQSLPGKAVAAFGDALSILRGVGIDILQGLWNGMQSKWEDVKGWVSEKAEELKELWKKPLDIFSPSQVMHDEVGMPIMQGLALGLEDGWKKSVEPAIAAFSSETKSKFITWQMELQRNLHDGITMTGEEIWSLLMNIKDSVLNSGLGGAGKTSATDMIDGFLNGLNEGAGVANEALSNFLGELIGKASAGMAAVSNIINGGELGNDPNNPSFNVLDPFVRRGRELIGQFSVGGNMVDAYSSMGGTGYYGQDGRFRYHDFGMGPGSKGSTINVTVNATGYVQDVDALAHDLQMAVARTM